LKLYPNCLLVKGPALVVPDAGGLPTRTRPHLLSLISTGDHDGYEMLTTTMTTLKAAKTYERHQKKKKKRHHTMNSGHKKNAEHKYMDCHKSSLLTKRKNSEKISVREEGFVKQKWSAQEEVHRREQGA